MNPGPFRFRGKAQPPRIQKHESDSPAPVHAIRQVIETASRNHHVPSLPLAPSRSAVLAKKPETDTGGPERDADQDPLEGCGRGDGGTVHDDPKIKPAPGAPHPTAQDNPTAAAT
jgi:hypothetical protein